MRPVYNAHFDLWVEAGRSGFTSAVVATEMQHSGYYFHPDSLRKDPVVVDVGGHVGVYSQWIAKTYPAGKVFYVEPMPTNIACAKKNFKGLRNITILEGVVTYEDNVVLHKYKPGCNSGGSQLRPEGDVPFDNGTNFQGTMRVQNFPLEHIIKFYGLKQIDILKLDCEGSEYSILTKCPCLNKVNRIVGEWHRVPGQLPFDEFCAKHLKKWKLTLHGSLTNPLGMFILERE